MALPQQRVPQLAEIALQGCRPARIRSYVDGARCAMRTPLDMELRTARPPGRQVVLRHGGPCPRVPWRRCAAIDYTKDIDDDCEQYEDAGGDDVMQDCDSSDDSLDTGAVMRSDGLVEDGWLLPEGVGDNAVQCGVGPTRRRIVGPRVGHDSQLEWGGHASLYAMERVAFPAVINNVLALLEMEPRAVAHTSNSRSSNSQTLISAFFAKA
jgi:hypothetical protein